MDKRVFIKADARAKYGNVVDVVDNVRSAGVDDVGLLTEQRRRAARQEAAEARSRGRRGAVKGVSYGNGSRGVAADPLLTSTLRR